MMSEKEGGNISTWPEIAQAFFELMASAVKPVFLPFVIAFLISFFVSLIFTGIKVCKPGRLVIAASVLCPCFLLFILATYHPKLSDFHPWTKDIACLLSLVLGFAGGLDFGAHRKRSFVKEDKSEKAGTEESNTDQR